MAYSPTVRGSRTLSSASRDVRPRDWSSLSSHDSAIPPPSSTRSWKCSTTTMRSSSPRLTRPKPARIVAPWAPGRPPTAHGAQPACAIPANDVAAARSAACRRPRTAAGTWPPSGGAPSRVSRRTRDVAVIRPGTTTTTLLNQRARATWPWERNHRRLSFLGCPACTQGIVASHDANLAVWSSHKPVARTSR